MINYNEKPFKHYKQEIFLLIKLLQEIKALLAVQPPWVHLCKDCFVLFPLSFQGLV